MVTFEEKAAEICSGLSDDKKRIDPITILTVISILISAIRLYIECKKRGRKANIKNLRLTDRIILRRLIKENSREKFDKKTASEIFGLIMEASKKATDQEISFLESIVNNQQQTS
jgi:hypothetical protein